MFSAHAVEVTIHLFLKLYKRSLKLLGILGGVKQLFYTRLVSQYIRGWFPMGSSYMYYVLVPRTQGTHMYVRPTRYRTSYSYLVLVLIYELITTST